MIPRKIDNTFLSNAEKETSFSVKASAKMFGMLSDKVYTHKIAAVVREITCNAYDAMVASDKGDIPFEITLPNSMHLYFEVEDFGVGMDEDDIDEIYTVFGESTKTTNKNLIGALGIGCKSPLSYSKTFSVRTRKNGIELNYNIYIGSDGEPKANQVTKSLTSEPNGVKISIPVREEDINKFRSETAFIASFFKVKPTIIGANFELLYEGICDELDTGKLVVRKYNGRNTSALYGYSNYVYAVMGGVCYSVDQSVLPDSVKTLFKNMKISAGSKTAFLKFELGELDFSMSRESLSYDDVTKENLVKGFENVVKEMAKSIQDKIDAETTIFSALNVFKDEFAGVFGSDIDTNSLRGYRGMFTYQSQELIDYFDKYLEFKGTGFNYLYHIGWNKLGRSNSLRLYDLLSKDTLRIVYTTGKNTRGIVDAAKKLQNINSTKSITLYFTNPLSDHKLNRIKKMINTVDFNVEYIDYADWREKNKPERLEVERRRQRKDLDDTEFYACPWVVSGHLSGSFRDIGFSTNINYSLIKNQSEVLDLEDEIVFFYDGNMHSSKYNAFIHACVLNHIIKNKLYNQKIAEGFNVDVKIHIVEINTRNMKIYQKNQHLLLDNIIKNNRKGVIKSLVSVKQAERFFNRLPVNYYRKDKNASMSESTKALIDLGFDVSDLGINRKDYEAFLSGDKKAIAAIYDKVNFAIDREDSDILRYSSESKYCIRDEYVTALSKFESKINNIRNSYPLLGPYCFAISSNVYGITESIRGHLKMYVKMIKDGIYNP